MHWTSVASLLMPISGAVQGGGVDPLLSFRNACSHCAALWIGPFRLRGCAGTAFFPDDHACMHTHMHALQRDKLNVLNACMKEKNSFENQILLRRTWVDPAEVKQQEFLLQQQQQQQQQQSDRSNAK